MGEVYPALEDIEDVYNLDPAEERREQNVAKWLQLSSSAGGARLQFEEGNLSAWGQHWVR